jgi:hypothetical protein
MHDCLHYNMRWVSFMSGWVCKVCGARYLVDWDYRVK